MNQRAQELQLEVGRRVDVGEERRVDLHSSDVELCVGVVEGEARPDGEAPLERGQRRLRPAPGSGPVCGTAASLARLAERAQRAPPSSAGSRPAGTTQTSCVAARRPATTPGERCPHLRPVVEQERGTAARPALPTASSSSQASPSTRQAAVGERLAAEPRRAPSASRSACSRRRRAGRPVRRSTRHGSRVDVQPSAAHEAAQRDAAVVRELDREARRRADRDEHRAAGDGRLLHELEREPAAHAEDASARAAGGRSRNAQPTTLSIALCRPTSSRRQRASPLGGEEPGRVQPAGRLERRPAPRAAASGSAASSASGMRRSALDARRLDGDRLEGALAADAARRRRVEAAAASRPGRSPGASTSTVFAARSSGSRAPVRAQALREREAERELLVVAGRPHRHGDRRAADRGSRAAPRRRRGRR